MNNIVIGGESMMEFDDNNGFHNTAIGFNSFLDLTGGQTNLAIGLQAGDNLVSGNYNFMIGTFAESYQANINGQLNIGNLIRGYKVSDIYRIHIGTPFQNKKAQFIAEGTLGTCTINSSTLCASDSRYKDNIENLADNLENVTALQPVHFEWKSNSKKDIGFIAQQVEDYLPEVIEKGSKGLEINYNSLMAYTVNALNENYIKLVELEKKCENESFQEIEKENQELENLINQLERLLSEKAKHG
jgi:hypothetical protein